MMRKILLVVVAVLAWAAVAHANGPVSLTFSSEADLALGK